MNESRRQILLDTPHTETATGAIASFETDMVGRAKEVKVEIEPVQDLHGYENPWPAGGGKNKLNLATDVAVLSGNVPSNVTITSADGTATITENYYNRDSNKFGWAFDVEENTNYTISGNAQSTSNVQLKIYSEDGSLVYSSTVTKDVLGAFNRTFNSGSNTKLYFYASITSWGQTIALTSMQIESGSTATDYAPYSNICPITGWDGVSIDTAVEAYKLLPTVAQTRWESSGIIIDYVGRGKYRIHGQRTGTVALPTIPVEPFIVPSGDGRRFDMHNSKGNSGVSIYLKSATGSTVDNWTMSPADRVSSGYTLMAGKTVAGFEIRCSPNDSIDFTFEPTFSKNKTSTVPISWIDEAGTVYGGHLTWLRDGTVRVTKTHESVNLSSLTWQRRSANPYRFSATLPSGKLYTNAVDVSQHKCSIFPTAYTTSMNNTKEGYLGIYRIPTQTGADNTIYLRFADTVTTLTELNAFLAETNAQYCYPLATPVTYTLTPQQALVFLRGTNNVWNDINDTSVTYWTHKTGGSV